MSDNKVKPDPGLIRVLDNRPSLSSYYAQPNPSPWGSGAPDVETQLRNEVTRLTDMLNRQDSILRQMAAPPFKFAVVVRKFTSSILVVKNNDTEEIPVTEGEMPKIQVGQVIRINAKAGVFAGVTDMQPTGQIATVERVLTPSALEVSLPGMQAKMVQTDITCSEGDRVMLDSTTNYVVKNLGKDKAKANKEAIEKVNVSWDDIGGQERAKTELREAIEGAHRFPELYKAYGKKPVKGILLFGPPGTGKTLLAKAVATGLASLYGKTPGTGFMYVKGPELLNKFVGESESGVRTLFQQARLHKQKEGFPAVIFIDEAEAVLGKRGDGGMGSGSFMANTMVPAFLTEMDGFDGDSPIVLLATNRPDVLDPAVVRDGRIDRKIECARPDVNDARTILHIYAKDKPVAGDRDEYEEAFVKALFQSRKLTARVSGALIAGLLEQAVSVAMRRDIDAGGTVSGLTVKDIPAIIKIVEQQNEKVANE